jgi:alkylation response protein AidB-like acyl-CoA dehydrogenase
MTNTIETPLVAEAPEQAAFRAEVRAFLAAHAKPKQDLGPWAVPTYGDPESGRLGFDEGRDWHRTRYAAGMTAFTYPTEYGGQGGEAWMERIYNEEARGYGSSSGFVHATISMLGPTLMAFGTEEQKRTILPRLLSAEDSYCQLFSEPGAGSDLASLACRAVLDGDEYAVNGQKVWNSAAQWCDRGFLLVRTNPDVPKHRGITMLLVDMDSPGVEARPLVQATGAAHFNEVFFEDVRIPAANVLGPVDGGWACARTVMSNESALIGDQQGSKTYPKLLLLAREFGKADDPVIRQRLAEAYTREQLLGFMGDRIMTAVRRRERPPIDPAILKLYVSENRVRSGNLASAIAGPAGILLEEDIQRWVHLELVGRYGISIGGGTTEVQLNNLAERALGLPKEPTKDRETPWSGLLRS